MKKIITTFVIIVILQLLPTSADLTFNINNCEAQWVQMSDGMGNDKRVYKFTSLGINSDNSEHVIFVGTLNYGIYLSTDNGQSWTQTTLNNQTVKSFATSVNNFDKSEQVIFAGTENYGLYRSTNYGQT